VLDIARRNKALERYAMSKNETAVTFGGSLREEITLGALEALKEELKKELKESIPKSNKEAILGRIRTLEAKLGSESKPYNSEGFGG